MPATAALLRADDEEFWKPFVKSMNSKPGVQVISGFIHWQVGKPDAPLCRNENVQATTFAYGESTRLLTN